MSLNRTVSDLKVKSITVRKKSGNTWIRPPESHFVYGAQYRIGVVFGNTGGMISWEDEQYRKDNVNIRIVAKGFRRSNGSYIHKKKIVFWKDAAFSGPVDWSNKYRTAFNIQTYETSNADCLFYAYFMVASGTPSSRQITGFYWDVGIYASVRNKKWRNISSTR